jgi:hypothetical protein
VPFIASWNICRLSAIVMPPGNPRSVAFGFVARVAKS